MSFFVLGLMDNCGQSYIGSAVALPDKQLFFIISSIDKN